MENEADLIEGQPEVVRGKDVALASTLQQILTKLLVLLLQRPYLQHLVADKVFELYGNSTCIGKRDVSAD